MDVCVYAYKCIYCMYIITYYIKHGQIYIYFRPLMHNMKSYFSISLATYAEVKQSTHGEGVTDDLTRSQWPPNECHASDGTLG